MENLVYVGSKPESVKAASDSILSILDVKADQETIRVALNCLSRSVEVGDISFTNCVIANNPPSEEIEESQKSTNNTRKPKRAKNKK